MFDVLIDKLKMKRLHIPYTKVQELKRNFQEDMSISNINKPVSVDKTYHKKDVCHHWKANG